MCGYPSISIKVYLRIAQHVLCIYEVNTNKQVVDLSGNKLESLK